MRERAKNPSSFMHPILGEEGEPMWQPVADVYRTKTGWLLKFELAGVMPEDVGVRAEGHRLTVSGLRRDWLLDDICSFYSMEISYNRFQRTIEIPCDLDAAHLDLEFRNGILLVRVTTEGRRA